MKKYVSLIFKSIIVVLGILGICIQIGVFDKSLNLFMLNYFTLLSNIMCIVYFICSIIYSIIHFKEDLVFLPWFKGVSLMCITLTMVVAQVMLKGMFPTKGLIGFSFLILHYILPIMTILDYILFDTKGLYKKYYPFVWIIMPIIYDLYINILVKFGFRFGTDGGKYPYPFQDVDLLGYPKVMMISTIMAIIFIILGYVLYFIDKVLKKSQK